MNSRKLRQVLRRRANPELCAAEQTHHSKSNRVALPTLPSVAVGPDFGLGAPARTVDVVAGQPTEQWVQFNC